MVEKELSSVTYRIRDPDSGKHQVVHVNRLKRCHVRPERLRVIDETPHAEHLGESAAEPAVTIHPSGYVRDATDWLYVDDEDPAREAYGGLDAAPGVPAIQPQQINAGNVIVPPQPQRRVRRRRPPDSPWLTMSGDTSDCYDNATSSHQRCQRYDEQKRTRDVFLWRPGRCRGPPATPVTSLDLPYFTLPQFSSV